MILLDTNALLWFLGRPDKLGPATTRALTASSEVRYSAISIAELRIKEMLGRLDLPHGLIESIQSAGLTSLPFSPEDAETLREFSNLSRHDPFDRMILSQAKAQGFELYTSDATLLGLSLPYVHDCRR